jgi:D-3-phosphoglycerate dehydrogenase / 2-oxoglutarate reductase
LKPGIPKEELLSVIGEYDGLVVRSGTQVDKDVIDAGTRLKVIGRAGTGVDNIDVKHATSRDVLVVNTPGGNTASTAELAFSHVLSLARNIPQASAALKAGKWDRSLYTGLELSGKVIGIIGTGNIGKEVAARCRAFGMVTVGYDPVLSDAQMRKNGIEPLPFDELLKKSDFITLHTPKTKDTTHMINASTIAKCKPGTFCVTNYYDV